MKMKNPRGLLHVALKISRKVKEMKSLRDEGICGRDYFG
jgi:hypothetical protein